MLYLSPEENRCPGSSRAACAEAKAAGEGGAARRGCRKTPKIHRDHGNLVGNRWFYRLRRRSLSFPGLETIGDGRPKSLAIAVSGIGQDALNDNVILSRKSHYLQYFLPHLFRTPLV